MMFRLTRVSSFLSFLLHPNAVLFKRPCTLCKKPPGWGVQLQSNSIYLRLTRIAGQIWGDAKLLGAPVAKVFEDWDQCLAGGAERVGDLRGRGAHCPSVDDAILFQFTQLRGEDFFADASQKIAEFGEAQRAKRKSPDCLDFPLAAQDVDGRLNRTAVVNLHRGLRAYKFVRTSPRYMAVIPCPSRIRPAVARRRKWEQK